MKNENDLISVCIANYNGEYIIEECIESILNQNYKNIEIIVHDDCSSDRSVEVLKNYGSRIRLILSDSNVGFCVSNNRMVNVAKGVFIFLFNNDAVLAINGLTELHNAMDREHAGILTLIQKDYKTGKTLDSGRMLDIFLNPIPCHVTKSSTQEVQTVHGACLFIRKKLWTELGGFPEVFGSVAEDLYLCLAAQAKGYRIYSVNKSVYLHRNGYSFGGGGLKNNRLQTSYRRRYLSERNKLLTMYLFYPYGYRILILLAILFLIVEGVVMSVLRLDFKIMKSIYFKSIKNFLQLRHSLKLNNKILLPKKFFRTISYIPYKLKMLFLFGLPKISNFN